MPDRIFSDFVIFSVTVLSTLVVLSILGGFYAFVWFSVPIGVLGYLKAKFSRISVSRSPN